jgi:CHASE2 domain-containing sensor protein/class 3 adenylate cyclase
MALQALAAFWKKHQQTLVAVMITCGVSLGVVGLRHTGAIAQLELRTYDYLLRLRPAEPKDDRVIIVAIDEPDIQRMGKWPWTDQMFADLISKISQGKPAVIGIDKYLDIPVVDQGRNRITSQVKQLLRGQVSPQILPKVENIIADKGRANLVEAMKQAGNVVNVTLSPTGDRQAIPLPPDLAQVSDQGFANILTDDGGIVRRALIAGDYGSFALVIANYYLYHHQQKTITFDPTTATFSAGKQPIPRLDPNFGGYHREDASGYQTLINYRGKEGSFATVSAADLLLGRVDPQIFHNKAVLIGVTAVSLKDSYPTPYSTGETVMYGVEIHANIASQLIAAVLDNRPFLQSWSEELETLWIVLWAIAGGMTAILASRVWLNFLALGLLGGALGGLTVWLFNLALWTPLFPALLGLVSANIAIIAYRLSIQESERKVLMGLFSRHVSKELANIIWEQREQFLQEGRIPGREVYVTVLFTDMRNFSTAAEAQKPGETLNWLNSYLSTIANEILQCGGMVDKYIGDSVMAVFGVPIPHTSEAERDRDAQNSVIAAIRVAEKLQQMNETWRSQGLPEVTTGIGINSGVVIAGSLGSAERVEYSVIGDTVNIAARLESFNKEVDGGEYHILISEETAQRLRGMFKTEFVGKYALKGKTQETAIYRVPPQPIDGKLS